MRLPNERKRNEPEAKDGKEKSSLIVMSADLSRRFRRIDGMKFAARERRDLTEPSIPSK